jgi:hypothetical protein
MAIDYYVWITTRDKSESNIWKTKKWKLKASSQQRV